MMLNRVPKTPELVTPVVTLDDHAEARPEATAFMTGTDVWSYGRLATETKRLAQAMLARGIKPGDRVAIHMANLPEIVLAYFACFRIGAIAAPLNARFKAAELRALLARLEPVLYLGQDKLYENVAPIESEILPHAIRFVVGNAPSGAQPWESLFDRPLRPGGFRTPDPDAPAMLLTTSGTTGLPKFVAHTPATVAAILEVLRQNDVQPQDIGIVTCPMVHGAGLMVFCALLHFGSPMVLIERFEAGTVLDAIARHRCSWMLGLPFMYAEMLAQQEERPRDVASLRYSASAGDVCPIEIQKQFPKLFNIPLHSVWGSTEVGALLPGSQIGPTTRAVSPIDVRIVDDTGARVARGEVGEVQVRGPTVALGYWMGPDRIDDFTVDGWFSTGDLMREEGENLWFVGRKKDLIIRGGSNISPVEVEAVLRADPAVHDVLVFGIPDPILGQRVAALIQLVGEEGPHTVSDIIAAAKVQMADYKVPERVKIVSEMPRNMLGKIDRKAPQALLTDA